MIDPTGSGSAQMIMDQIKAYQTRVEQKHINLKLQFPRRR